MVRERGHVLVVLRPPAKVSLLDIPVEQPRNRDGGPDVCQVIRGPSDTTPQKDGSVEIPEDFPLLAEEVKRNREEGTDQETPQEAIVDGTSTKHLLRSEGTPEDRSCEEGVDSRAGEVVFLIGCADLGNPRNLVVEGSCTDKSGNKGSEHLAVEGDPRWNVGVVSEFEVPGKVEGVRGGDVSIGLKVVHGSSVTGEPEAPEQLGDNVEGKFHIGGSHNDAARNTKYYGEEDTIQYNGRGGAGGVSGNTGGTDTDGDTQDDEVDPFRDLFVRSHQAGMDVPGVGKG